jgi:hypothetical protein
MVPPRAACFGAYYGGSAKLQQFSPAGGGLKTVKYLVFVGFPTDMNLLPVYIILVFYMRRGHS